MRYYTQGRRPEILTLNAYQGLAAESMKELDLNIVEERLYLMLGLCSEAGEVGDLLLKSLKYKTNSVKSSDVALELGDVLWFLAIIADSYGLLLGNIADDNLAKLQERHSK